MEHNTDRILWTVLVLAIGVGLYTVFHPAANGLLGQTTEKIQDIATNVNSNKSDNDDLDFSYSEPNTTDHTISIVGYSGSKENLTTPQYHKIGSVSYKVTAIGDSAFAYTKLTSVHLPDGLTSIGNWAFSGTKLTSIDLPASLTSIGDYAFDSTPLTSVHFPAGLTSIGDGAFANTKLTSVDFPSGLTSIGDSAFAYTSISAISFKKRVDLDELSFINTDLKNVTLPTGSTYKTDANAPTFDSSVKVTFN